MTKPKRVVAGRDVLSFCSNDYLGLASDERVIAALRRGAETFGAGAGASALINGYTRAHRELEERLADFTGRDRALVFSSGYMANLGVMRALAGRDVFGDVRVFSDRLNHASLVDAVVLARARASRYPHADAVALKRMLAAIADGERAVVATDAVFGMDGDCAPLAEIATVCQAHDAALLVDDAHGFGVLGERAAGTLERDGLSQDDVPILVATFGKALGTFGAFAAGGKDLIEWLIQEARTYIYTTAPPPAIACATLESLCVIEVEPWRRRKLRDNVASFRRLAGEAGLPGLLDVEPPTPIQALVVGTAEAACAMSGALLDDGLQVTAMRPPTVPRGTSRLRITLSAAHEPDDIERLVASLVKCAKSPAFSRPLPSPSPAAQAHA